MCRQPLVSASILCLVLLAASASSLQGSGSVGAGPDTPDLQSSSFAVPGWVRANISGFGDPENVGVTALEVFEDQLYAGTCNVSDGGRVWRTDDGTLWVPVSDVGFGHASVNAAIIDMIEFGGWLYASTGWAAEPGEGGQIWRTQNGTSWEPVESDGFGDAGNHSVTAFTVFSSTLYAATGNDNGLQVWRSGTGAPLSWTNVVTAGLGYSTNRQITGFAEFGDTLYAAVESNVVLASAQVWRTTDGTTWEVVIADGFGDPDNYSTGGFTRLGSDLYLGTRNDMTGAQLWRTGDGMTWTSVLSNGFGDSGNVKIESLSRFGDHLYAAAYNTATGIEVWRSPDGTTWQQVNADGFGGSSWSTLWSNATVIFRDHLFVGTWNDAGGEVWMTVPRRLALPLVTRNHQAVDGIHRSQPHFQVFILNPVRTCLVGNDFASGSVCRGPNCGDCDCTWEQFDPPAPMVGVSPDHVNDPQYAGYAYKDCVTITLTQQEVDDIIADMQLVRDEVFEWSGGALDLQMEFTVLPHDHIGFVAPDFVFGPFEVDDELLNPYVTTQTDFVYVVSGVYDRAQGFHLAYACGGSYGEMSIHGAGYANIQYGGPCNSVTIAGQSVYEPLIHEWMHNLDWALYYINLVPDIYQHVWPDWEHWDPGSWPACSTGAANTYAWFPSVDLCEWDPDWRDCNNEASAGACLHAGEVGGSMSWYEHVISAHYPRSVHYVGNHCRDGRQDFGESGVDQGWPCP